MTVQVQYPLFSYVLWAVCGRFEISLAAPILAMQAYYDTPSTRSGVNFAYQKYHARTQFLNNVGRICTCSHASLFQVILLMINRVKVNGVI